MLCGLMDHWVPSADTVSRFWKTPFETLEPLMADLCDEVATNHFTFYTKWYTHGYRSSLPFLPNHPDAQNTRTDNAWGRRWIEFFHRRGMTVGAMIQSYAYLPGCFPGEPILGVWHGTHRCTGLAADQDNVIVDPTWEGFTAHFEAMLEEQLRLFPGLDAVFLEFEGLPAAVGAERVSVPGEDRNRYRFRSEGGTVSPALRAQWAESAWDVPEQDQWIWTEPVQAILAGRLRVHLAAAERVLDRMGFTGIRGIVYHAMSYETPYLTACLPSRDWWLLPWHYWGWDFCRDTPDAVIRRQMDWCQRQFLAHIQEGRPLCYIGNATLPTERYESIREMAAFCRDRGAAGHLGMGNPIPEYGLRWHEATEESVRKARKLYRELFRD